MARVMTETATRLGRVFRIEIAQPLKIAAARIEWCNTRKLGEIVIYTEPLHAPVRESSGYKLKQPTDIEWPTTNKGTQAYPSRTV